MEVIVEGVRIQLTSSQIKTIEKARKQRERCRNSFEKILKHFGFKPCADAKDCYEHEKGWFADIHKDCVWMVGEGLKCGGFPGGWIYWSPEEIEKEIIRALSA